MDELRIPLDTIKPLLTPDVINPKYVYTWDYTSSGIDLCVRDEDGTFIKRIDTRPFNARYVEPEDIECESSVVVPEQTSKKLPLLQMMYATIIFSFVFIVGLFVIVQHQL